MTDHNYIEKNRLLWNSRSLLKNGLASFDEFDYSPYNCFKETIKCEPKKYPIKHLGNKIPMVYAIVATKIKTV